MKEKEELVEAIKFKYEYEYKGQEQIIDKPIEEDSLYHFNVQNDTLGYDLKIWSTHLQSIDCLSSYERIYNHSSTGW